MNCKTCEAFVIDKKTNEKRHCENKVNCKENPLAKYCYAHRKMESPITVKPTSSNQQIRSKLPQVPRQVSKKLLNIEYIYVTPKNVKDPEMSKLIDQSYPHDQSVYIMEKNLYINIQLDENLEPILGIDAGIFQNMDLSLSNENSVTKAIIKYVQKHPENIKQYNMDLGIPGPHERLVIGLDKTENKIIGSVSVTLKKDQQGFILCKIGYVSISLNYRGKKLCRPLFEAACQLVLENEKNIQYFKLEIVSRYSEKAFTCYASGGLALGYNVYMLETRPPNKFIQVISIKSFLKLNVDYDSYSMYLSPDQLNYDKYSGTFKIDKKK